MPEGNARFVSIQIDHPSARDKANGAASTVSLLVNRGLKSGKLDSIPLNQLDLLKMIRQASGHLDVLLKQNSGVES